MQSLDGILYTFPSTFKLLSTASIYSSVRKTLYCQALRVLKRLNTSATTSWIGTLSHLSKWKLGKYNCKNIPSFLTPSNPTPPPPQPTHPAAALFMIMCLFSPICAQMSRLAAISFCFVLAECNRYAPRMQETTFCTAQFFNIFWRSMTGTPQRLMPSVLMWLAQTSIAPPALSKNNHLTNK